MTFHTIIATYQHPQAAIAYKDCYCYDEPNFNLIAEPLVHDATEVIIGAMICARLSKPKENPKQIKLTFSEDPNYFQSVNDPVCKDNVVVHLTYVKAEDDYSMYSSEVIAPEAAAVQAALAELVVEDPLVPLCPHLMDYFPSPPKEFYVKITPIENKALHLLS